MEDKIKKQIEEEALRRFPEDEYDDEYFTERYYFKEGAKYGYNIKESVNDKLDFYAMDLNTERIKTYTALSERYNLDISSIRDIFDAGLNFAAGKYESIFSASNEIQKESVNDKLLYVVDEFIKMKRPEFESPYEEQNYDEIHQLAIEAIGSVLSASNQENNDGWISVEDRLPEVNQMVDIYYKEDSFFKRITNIVYERDGFIGFKKQEGSVTHWMPLPKPPKEK